MAEAEVTALAEVGTTSPTRQSTDHVSDVCEDPLVVSKCAKEASNIQAIDKASVHRICSGQVVLTLATAVKELVENSIDAGATNVEIKLKEYGSESIEVTDNGLGVDEKDFEGLTLKHHTSKLQDFDDLVNVTSFGFRGEALSSLCALSNMVIMTRHMSAAVGTRLEFDLNGKIVSRKYAPRQVGTTVLVHNVFHTLPVRQKEFHRNLKKEFAKLVHVLNAYCLISTKVRISCTNQVAKGSRSTVVSTNGNDSVKENIANIFSPKQLQSLLEFRQVEADDDVCSDFGLKPKLKSSVNFRLEGFVSKCEHGQGRSSSDRQFIFINRRPCDHAKVVKLINEVYHSYNRHQNPFVALSISVDKESVDVNVTPDKRQIFLEGENLLLATLKTSLVQMFESTTAVYKVNNVLTGLPAQRLHNTPANSPSPNFQDSSSPSLASSLSKLKRSFSSAFARSDSSDIPHIISSDVSSSSSSVHSIPCRKSSSFPVSSERGSITELFSRSSPKKSTSSTVCTLPSTVCTLPKSPTQAESDITTDTFEINDSSDSLIHQEQTQNHLFCEDPRSDHISEPCPSHVNNNDIDGENGEIYASMLGMSAPGHLDKPGIDIKTSVKNTIESDSEQNNSRQSGLTIHFDHVTDLCVAYDKPLPPESLCLSDADKIESHFDEPDGGKGCEIKDVGNMDESQPFVTDLDLCQDSHDSIGRREQNVSFCLSSLRRKINSHASSNESTSQLCRSFRAKICPTDNRSAEDELQKEISKDMFDKMEVIGQFNLGFIITQLGRDLFIVDQHATDEKYNFEMLQKTTVLQSQKMIVPQSLELTASNETILLDNLEVFRKNGFDFFIDTEAAPTQRVKLMSAPVSNNWRFGKDDIEELLFMLSDSPNVMCWPSRVRMMFASRACRKSVMIGTALNKYEMKRLVSHMGQIEQPWNCPHGRPTMRHLFNLDMLPTSHLQVRYLVNKSPLRYLANKSPLVEISCQ